MRKRWMLRSHRASPASGGACPGKKAPDNAVAILNRVKGYAEQKNVTLCMENTNSKIAADQRTDQWSSIMWHGDLMCASVSIHHA